MSRRKVFLKTNASKEKYDAYIKALNAYNPNKLEENPQNPSQIYEYYSYVDELYVWLKKAYSDDICVVCNEMRAILGHLAEYDPSNENNKNNLGKAYGHFRRLSIDTLKIICTSFDKEFDVWIRKHAMYDYRGIDADFFPKYVTLYHEAHRAYIDAQKSENLGSDRENKIIVKYYNVAKLYGEVYKHHVNERRLYIEKITQRFKVSKVVWVIATLLLTLISVTNVIL